MSRSLGLADAFSGEFLRALPPKRAKEYSQIELKGRSKPMKKVVYRMSHTELAQIKKQVEQLILMRFVRPSKSLWASPVLLESKKDGSLVFCVHYRVLNRFILTNSYHLPRIGTLMVHTGTGQYSRAIDLRK